MKRRTLRLLTTKGTAVPPSRRGSDEWMRREMHRWNRLARAVRRG